MSVRRKSDSSMTQRIWDTIKITVHQRSLPSNDRMVRHLARVYGFTEQEAQDELNKAVEDGLVLLKKVPAKSGVEQESYRLPSVNTTENDSHDWYCCKCQRAGAVECCEQCHRVYHPECHAPSNAKLKICNFCEVRIALFARMRILLNADDMLLKDTNNSVVVENKQRYIF